MAASFARVLVAVVLLVPFTGCVNGVDAYTEDVGAFLQGEKSFHDLVNGIARDLRPNATLEVRDVRVLDERSGTFGETIRADPGYAFFHVTVRLSNTGNVPFSASTWEFTAIDALGSETPAEADAPHHDFDATRIRESGRRDGVLVFEMREDATLAAVAWNGALASATGNVTRVNA